MEKNKLSLDITNPSKFYNLGIELWLDNNIFFDQAVAPGLHSVVYEFDEDEKDHEFKIVLKNKLEEHTKIDESGNIIDDVLINVSNVRFDEIDIDQIMWKHAEYIHNGNETHKTKSHNFYGDIGCNGAVSLKFSTPIYLWLLENM